MGKISWGRRSWRRKLAVPAAAVCVTAFAAFAPAASATASGDVCFSSVSPTGYSVTTCLTVAQGPVSGSVPVSTAVETSINTARVGSVVFSLDNVYLLTDYEAPYTFSWPSEQVADGQHDRRHPRSPRRLSTRSA